MTSHAAKITHKTQNTKCGLCITMRLRLGCIQYLGLLDFKLNKPFLSVGSEFNFEGKRIEEFKKSKLLKVMALICTFDNTIKKLSTSCTFCIGNYPRSCYSSRISVAQMFPAEGVYT
jgi:hypothetical protein